MTSPHKTKDKKRTEKGRLAINTPWLTPQLFGVGKSDGGIATCFGFKPFDRAGWFVWSHPLRLGILKME